MVFGRGTWDTDSVEVTLPPGRHAVVLYASDVHGARGIAWASSSCSVYAGSAEVDEPCTYYELYPPMTDCRPGLTCREGACRDLVDPRPLHQGEICSETQSVVPTGFLGQCTSGLRCDSSDTRACVPDASVPPVPPGGACSSFSGCESGSYCRPPEGNDHVSEQAPGRCTGFTPADQPCSLPYECERACEHGTCQPAPPQLCEILDDWTAARELLAQDSDA